MSQELFNDYFKKISRIHKTGQATELTYRHDFQNFIESLFPDLKLSEENKSIRKIGRPDYTCFLKSIKIGYIETKDIGIDLDKELKSEQIKKYSEGAIPNIILTDYIRFVLIRTKEGKQEILFDINLFKGHELSKDKKIFEEKIINEFKKLIETFVSYSLSTIKNATELAIQLSKRAKLLRDLVKEQLEEDLENKKNNVETSTIYDFYEAFKELIKDAKLEECVDAYAQTITYGLFLSKIGSHDGLSRDSAVTYIPSSMKIIKKIFMNIAGDELPKNLSWIVDEIVDVLNHSDIQKILSEFVFEGKNYKDPFIHFYEDFLKEYNPEARKHLGVYYTPEPIVSFITESINEILKKEFSKTLGFGEDSVKILDPATGTGTFIANAFYLALREIRKKGMAGIEKEKIKNHLLKDFYAFEILVSPYVISHLKLNMMLEKEGYSLKDNDRVQVYLTNTLNLSDTLNSLSGFFKDLSHETLMANTIKRETPILVVLGNPPYSVISSNKSEWIMEKIKDYKIGLKERRLGNLDDDYVKFVKFGQWKIEQHKDGIIGFITNNSFIDGLTFRRMRESLLKSFDLIYILNLHGDLRKKEKSPDGSKDENVFDIRQGVSISLFIKNKELKNKGVFYYDLYGKRKEKYDFLYNNDYTKVNWEELKPNQPNFFFIKKDFSGKRKYDKFYPITEIFEIYSSGVKTHKDHFLVSFDKKILSNNIQEFLNKKKDEFYLRDKFNLKDTMNWKMVEARNNQFKEDNIKEFYYRPFDFRFIYYENKIITRPLRKVMKHFFKENIGLVTTRIGLEANNVLISKNISDIHLTGGQSYIFPLYTYNDKDKEITQKTLDGREIKTKIGKHSNFKEEFLRYLEQQYPNQKITPEEIISYIYAVLHSENYYKKYEEFLKIDFPRIPFVKEYKKFRRLSEFGNSLRDLHLMKINFNRNIAKFEKSGSNQVEFIKYEKDRIYINKDQYFSNINKEVWEFYIGGYQVLDKWLKSRKNRKLNSIEIETFINIINILSETIKVMEKIDKIKID